MAEPDPPTRRRVVRYVALGDSYTVGTGVEAAEAWPVQLVERIGRGPAPVRLELVANLGVNGFTSADVLRAEVPRVGDAEPGFASLLVGVNDVVQGVSEVTYGAGVGAILGALLTLLPAARIVTIGTPDYTVTPAGADYGEPAARRAAIERFNAILAAESAARGIAHVDIWMTSRRAAADVTLVASDGLHPSGRQYAAWVDAIAPIVERLLAEPAG